MAAAGPSSTDQAEASPPWQLALVDGEEPLSEDPCVWGTPLSPPRRSAERNTLEIEASRVRRTSADLGVAPKRDPTV